MNDEIKTLKEKMQKLAVQFDKELTEKERQMKSYQNINSNDITKSSQALKQELEYLSSKVLELDAKKIEKKDLNQMKSELNTNIE